MIKTNLSDSFKWTRESLELFKKTHNQSLLISLCYFGLFLVIPSILFSIELPDFLNKSIPFLSFSLIPIFFVFSINFYRLKDKNLKNKDIFLVFKLIKKKIFLLLSLGLFSLLYLIYVNKALETEVKFFLDLTSKNEVLNLDKKIIHLILHYIFLILPFIMITWFSPVLIANNGYSLMKAIKSSVAGFILYFIPLLFSWLIFLLWTFLVMFIFGGIIELISFYNSNISALFGIIFIPLLFLINFSILSAFQYITYRDIFKSAKSY